MGFRHRDPAAAGRRPDRLLYTRYQSAWEGGFFGGVVAALLRETPSGWLVYEYDLGATDVVWLEWRNWYPVPPEVFPN